MTIAIQYCNGIELLPRAIERVLGSHEGDADGVMVRRFLAYADDGSTNCECPNYNEDGDDYAALSSEEIYQDYVERFFRDPLDPDLVTGNTLILATLELRDGALPGRRRHARRYPRGRDDARGDRKNRAARAWRRAPDHDWD